MTRRSLLAALPAVAAAQSRVKIAFLGLSHSHAMGKLQVCRQSGGWEVVAAADPDKTRVAKAGVPLASKEEILRDPSIQVVAVESDVKDHGRHGIEVLEAGKHMHLEKPPADTMADLERIVRLAREKKLLVQGGYMWRHHPGMHAIFDAVKQGWLGDVHMIRGQMNTLVDARARKDWARFRGGQMFEQGCHIIDALVRLMGKPARISPFLRHDGKFDDTLADNTAAVFEWARAIAVITHSVLQPDAGQHRMFEVMGSNGTAVLRPIEGPPKLEIDLAKAAGPYRKGRQEVALPAYARYVGDMAELARCVRTGSALNVTLEQELDVQRAVLAACGM